MNEQLKEHFLNLILKMDEKDIIDFVEANADEITASEELDDFVVRMIFKIGEKININDPNWFSYYLKLVSRPERYQARMTIYQLLKD